MDAPLPNRILDVLDPGSGDPLTLVVYVGLALVVLLLIVWKIVGGRRRPPQPETPNLDVDLAAMGEQGPAGLTPVLELNNVPVRLAAVVLTPAGRVRELPPMNRRDELLEVILPGLKEVVAAHRPLMLRWPAQFSASGFAHTFARHVRLPGDGGRGTPWSSVAGVFKIEGQPLMAGLVLRSESANSLGQQIVDSEDKWLGCLRVKSG